MNISSVIVTIETFNLRPLIEKITAIKECEVPTFAPGKLIVTIEAPSTDMEVAIIREIENMDGVRSVHMAYSYSEDELDKERDNIELATDSPVWLNKDDIDAKDIPYSGKLKV